VVAVLSITVVVVVVVVVLVVVVVSVVVIIQSFVYLRVEISNQWPVTEPP
jgi:hypothetical protein